MEAIITSVIFLGGDDFVSRWGLYSFHMSAQNLSGDVLEFLMFIAEKHLLLTASHRLSLRDLPVWANGFANFPQELGPVYHTFL